MNAANSTFTSTSLSIHWSGIKFNSGSQGILDGCETNNVQAYGGYAIAITGASPTIQNCTIENNTIACGGISVSNNGSHVPYIYHNIIRNNTYHGIYIYNSDAYLRFNTISAQTTNGRAAVYCDYFSTPLFAAPSGGYEEGKNTLQNSYYGLYGGYYSNINAGTSGNAYHNRFINNSYANVYASYYTTIWAQYDWWGQPYPTKFYTVNNSVIHPDHPLTSDPGPGAQIVTAGNIAAGDVNSETFSNQSSSGIAAAENSSDIQTTSNDIKRNLANLVEEYRNSKDKSIISYIKPYVDNITDPDSIRPIAIEALANIYDIDSSTQDAIFLNETLIKEYPSSIHEKNGKMDLFFNYFNSGNYAKAKQVLTSIDKAYSKNNEVMLAYWLINANNSIADENYKKENNVSLESEKIGFDLFPNYPNPFNPTTTISYNLPRMSDVELKIYDILGHEVKSYFISSQSAGTQNIVWNGMNNYNEHVSSGIYIYRFKAVSREGKNEVFEKSAKLIMLK